MLCVASPDPSTKMTRKRSVVWGFFKAVAPQSVQCLLCRGFQSRQLQGSTTAMLRHLRVKHPQEVARTRKGRGPEAVPRSGLRCVEADGGRSCSVEGAMGDGDSDVHTTMIESDISSAINNILESAGDPAEQTVHGEAGVDCPVRGSRHKRSLIWRHYERLDSLNAARCHICMKKLQCFKGGGTSNLRRHMSKRHPEVFSRLVADGFNPPASSSSQGSNIRGNSLTTAQTVGTTEQRTFARSRAPDGERRVLRRERELIEALRRTQKEEERALEHQRELLMKLRTADAREAAAESEKIQSLRKAQQEEAKELNKLREDVQKEKVELEKEKEELQKKWEEIQQERAELLLFSRGQ